MSVRLLVCPFCHKSPERFINHAGDIHYVRCVNRACPCPKREWLVIAKCTDKNAAVAWNKTVRHHIKYFIKNILLAKLGLQPGFSSIIRGDTLWSTLA